MDAYQTKKRAQAKSLNHRGYAFCKPVVTFKGFLMQYKQMRSHLLRIMSNKCNSFTRAAL